MASGSKELRAWMELVSIPAQLGACFIDHWSEVSSGVMSGLVFHQPHSQGWSCGHTMNALGHSGLLVLSTGRIVAVPCPSP